MQHVKQLKLWNISLLLMNSILWTFHYDRAQVVVWKPIEQLYETGTALCYSNRISHSGKFPSLRDMLRDRLQVNRPVWFYCSDGEKFSVKCIYFCMDGNRIEWKLHWSRAQQDTSYSKSGFIVTTSCKNY